MSTICMCTFLFMQLIDLSYSSEHKAYQVHQSDRPETSTLLLVAVIGVYLGPAASPAPTCRTAMSVFLPPEVSMCQIFLFLR